MQVSDVMSGSRKEGIWSISLGNAAAAAGRHTAEMPFLDPWNRMVQHSQLLQAVMIIK